MADADAVLGSHRYAAARAAGRKQRGSEKAREEEVDQRDPEKDGFSAGSGAAGGGEAARFSEETKQVRKIVPVVLVEGRIGDGSPLKPGHEEKTDVASDLASGPPLC